MCLFMTFRARPLIYTAAQKPRRRGETLLSMASSVPGPNYWSENPTRLTITSVKAFKRSHEVMKSSHRASWSVNVLCYDIKVSGMTIEASWRAGEALLKSDADEMVWPVYWHGCISFTSTWSSRCTPWALELFQTLTWSHSMHSLVNTTVWQTLLCWQQSGHPNRWYIVYKQ